MMRYNKIFIVLSLILFVAGASLAQTDSLIENGEKDKPVFFKINKDLRRVGLDEIRRMSSGKSQYGVSQQSGDYILSEGDIITINFWGKLEGANTLIVDKEGDVVIPRVGKVNVFNLTLNDAHSAIKKELDKKYSNVQFDLDLKRANDIKVLVLGNAFSPGTYYAAPSSRMDEIIAKSGGPNYNGSISDIKLIRNSKEIASFNVYDFIFKGDQTKNLQLKNDDTIYIPVCKNLIAIRGYIKYPGIYETGYDAPISKVLDMAGGSISESTSLDVNILRVNGNTRLTEVYKSLKIDSSKGVNAKEDVLIKNFDSIVVSPEGGSTIYPENILKTVTILGEVNAPGDYLVKKGSTIASLIKNAGGLKDAAFLKGAILKRHMVKEQQQAVLDEFVNSQKMAILNEETRLTGLFLTNDEKIRRDSFLQSLKQKLDIIASRTPDGRIIINLEDIVSGKSDIILESEDFLYIPASPDWVLVTGAVYQPGAVIFISKKPLDYYVNSVGGPIKSAEKDDIYVIKPDGRVESKSTGINEINNGDIIVMPEKCQ